MNVDQILDILKRVYDPDFPEQSLIALGVVEERGIQLTEGSVMVTYCLKSPVCPYSAAIGLLIRRALEQSLTLAVEVRLDADHYQAAIVNGILADEAKSRELADRMESTGLFAQCLKG